jgi:hypothetical protein
VLKFFFTYPKTVVVERVSRMVDIWMGEFGVWSFESGVGSFFWDCKSSVKWLPVNE